jgi:putative ABC transport system permease protein
MWLLIRTAWRNLFRQRRRTIITASAMAISLAMAIPTHGLIGGVREEFYKGITGMDLGHAQLHDPAYPKGRALQSTLRRPDKLLQQIRSTPGVVAAAARAHGFALLSHEVALPLELVPLKADHAARSPGGVRFGRPINSKAPWRADVALACEAVISHAASMRHGVVVGNVLAPESASKGGVCERIRIVGLTKAPLSTGSARVEAVSAPVILGMTATDIQIAFQDRRRTRAVSRNAAPIAIMGVDPAWERRVTFMASKVVQGRYLAAAPANEIVVGYRLAKIMRLTLGAKVFVQAATLDSSSGDNTGTLKVVGIYRTGVENVDRTRVFLHLADTQRLMSLEGRAHEIALVGKDLTRLRPVVNEIKRRIARLRLRVSVQREGTRAGSRPLRAAVTIRDRAAGDAGLLIPHDLMPRFDDLPGLGAVARRVYGKAEVQVAQTFKARMGLLGKGPNVFKDLSKEAWAAITSSKYAGTKCGVAVARPLAERWKLRPGQRLIPMDAVTDNESGCSELMVSAIVDQASPEDLARRNKPLASIVLLTSLSTAEAEEAALPLGEVTLLLPKPGSALRFVGVEGGAEARLSGLPKRLSAGTYFPAVAAEEETTWPVLLSPQSAKRLGASVGTTLLLKTRDGDRRLRWHAARVLGVLKQWDAALPELVLPYYSAQQVDAPRLNARAHEMLLIPKPGVNPDALARAADKRLVPLVRTWDEIRPSMKDLAGMQNLFMGIMLFIILAIAGLTVMNTMLMAVFERIREFGVLKSIGMRPSQVFGLIVFEALLLGVLAAIFGGSAGLGLEYYLMEYGLDLSGVMGGITMQGTFINPVWKAVFSVQGVLVPMFMVSVVCLGVSFYPALKAGRLKPVEAMRHHQ